MGRRCQSLAENKPYWKRICICYFGTKSSGRRNQAIRLLRFGLHWSPWRTAQPWNKPLFPNKENEAIIADALKEARCGRTGSIRIYACQLADASDAQCRDHNIPYGVLGFPQPVDGVPSDYEGCDMRPYQSVRECATWRRLAHVTRCNVYTPSELMCMGYHPCQGDDHPSEGHPYTTVVPGGRTIERTSEYMDPPPDPIKLVHPRMRVFRPRSRSAASPTTTR